MKRPEFPRRVKLAAWDRAGGKCETCGKKIYPGDGPEYDHAIAAEHGGGNELDNCSVLCKTCHRRKTGEDMTKTVKGRKVRAQRANAKTTRSPLPGSRNSKWKRTFNGWEPRE